MESCALVRNAFKPDLSTLHFDQRFGDVQSQASAGNIAHFLVISPEEFLEYFLLIFRADANSIILDNDMHHLAALLPDPIDCFHTEQQHGSCLRVVYIYTHC